MTLLYDFYMHLYDYILSHKGFTLTEVFFEEKRLKIIFSDRKLLFRFRLLITKIFRKYFDIKQD